MLWLGLLLLLFSAAAVRLEFRLPRLDTEITALLPSADDSSPATQVLEQMAASGANTLFLMLEGTDTAQTRQALETLVPSLERAGLTLVAPGSEQQLALGKALFPYRFGLLSDQARTRLNQDDPQLWLKPLLRALATPGTTPAAGLISQDPLLLFPDYLSSLAGSQGNWHPGPLALERPWEDRQLLLSQWQVEGSAFDMGRQQSVLDQLAQFESANPQIRLSRVGVLFHAAEAARSARQEMTWLGSASLLMVVLLSWLAFRRLMPLAWLLLVVGSSMSVGVLACLLLLGELHAITLVFGTTLVGVAVDYTLHLSCHGAGNSRRAASMLRRPMALALISSCLAYLVMLLLPFPGLKQMAVFSVAGLCWAFVTVQWMPAMGFDSPSLAPGLVPRAGALAHATRRLTGSTLFWAPLLALTLTGLSRLGVDDDIRHLQHSDPQLLSQQDRVQTLLSQPDQSRMLLVEGATAEQVLQIEEALNTRLDTLVTSGALTGYRGVSASLPSLARQRSDRQLLARRYQDPGLVAMMQGMGFDPKMLPRLSQAIEQAPLLTPERWLSHDALAPLQMQWLGQGEQGWRTVVLLEGVRDLDALKSLADGREVQYLDRVEDLSQFMAHYRLALSVVMGLILLAALLLVSRSYGLGAGVRIVAAPTVSALLVLALWGLLGTPVNLFHMLGLLLMFGIALDQSLFLATCGPGELGRCALAIGLSVVSTVAAFGMLGLSQTPALAAFGQSLSLGLLAALVLSTLALTNDKKDS
ncbi:MMPL family efflux pump permease component [Ferrimonas sp. YFM]|nr:MMPL family efflux pump permease component [Ferrimonas sp. YFM]